MSAHLSMLLRDGSYVPAGFWEDLPFKEADNGLGLAAIFLANELPECAPWYKMFLHNTDGQLVHGNRIAVSKDGDSVVLRFICALDAEVRQASCRLAISNFIEVIDQWCLLIKQRPPQILVTYNNGKVELIPQFPETDY